MSEIVEDSSKIIDYIFDLVLSFIQSFLEISSSTKMPFSATPKNACS